MAQCYLLTSCDGLSVIKTDDPSIASYVDSFVNVHLPIYYGCMSVALASDCSGTIVPVVGYISEVCTCNVLLTPCCVSDVLPIVVSSVGLPPINPYILNNKELIVEWNGKTTKYSKID